MNWFYQQSRRDQIALIICAVFLLIYLLWIAVIKPLNQAAETAVNRKQATAASLARVKVLAATLEEHQRRAAEQPRQEQMSMANLLDSSTRATGLRATSMDPSADGQTASVRFDNANLSSILQWLYELEHTHHVQIDYLSLIAANEPGQVMATVRVRKS